MCIRQEGLRLSPLKTKLADWSRGAQGRGKELTEIAGAVYSAVSHEAEESCGYLHAETQSDYSRPSPPALCTASGGASRLAQRCEAAATVFSMRAADVRQGGYGLSLRVFPVCLWGFQ